MSDIVRLFLSVLGTALVRVGHPGHYNIPLRNDHVGHELERPLRWAVPVLQGQNPERDGYSSVDDGTDCYDHYDLFCGPLACEIILVIKGI